VPSWSWITVDSEIFFPEVEKYGLACVNVKVLQVHLTPSGTDPLHDIKHGILRLSCEILIHATIKFKLSWWRVHVIVNEKEILVDVTLDHDDLNEEYDLNNDPITQFRRFYFLPVQGYGSKFGAWIIGLCLESTGQRGVLRRIGMFELPGKKPPRDFEEYVMKDATCHVPKKEYYRIRKDKFGREHRIITII
jgi:hypothetical protein